MRIAIVILAVSLMSCKAKQTQVIEPPAAKVIQMPVPYYVPVDKVFLLKCRWTKEAKPSQVFEVNAERKACLLKYENQLDGVGKIQGKPVPEGKK